MNVIVVKCSLARGNHQYGRIYSNGGNRWNILGFNFTTIDALSSVYKIFMDVSHYMRLMAQMTKKAFAKSR